LIYRSTGLYRRFTDTPWILRIPSYFTGLLCVVLALPTATADSIPFPIRWPYSIVLTIVHIDGTPSYPSTLYKYIYIYISFTYILKANPATEYTNFVYIDYVEENKQFKRLYIQPSCAKSTFVNYLLLVLFDGTFFLNAYHQTILLAIGRDGNNCSNVRISDSASGNRGCLFV
jgi:hypothetical protein